MRPSHRFVARTALIICGLMLADCESMETPAQNSNGGNTPTTMRLTQANRKSANTNDSSYWNDTRFIGNGAFGEPPPR